jgi:hypothetical protein
MADYAERLLGGADDGEVTQTGGYADRLLGIGPSAASGTPPKPKGSVFTNTWDAIKGKHDPRYADTPDMRDVPLGWGGHRVLFGAMAGADDAALGAITQKALGDKFRRRFKDANGYEMIEFAAPDGSIQTRYINKPGLDARDVARGVFGAIPYIIGGGAVGTAMKGISPLFRAPAQMGVAATTSVLQDLGAMGLGSEQGVDSTKALMAGGTAGLFEALPSKAIMPILGGVSGAVMSDDGDRLEGAGLGAAAGAGAAFLTRHLFGMNPNQYMRNGKLTPEAEELARRGGIDPANQNADVLKRFAETYAKTRDAAKAAIDAEAYAGPGSVRLTKGVRDKDFQQMVLEDKMRAGIKGPQAKAVMDEFDRLQARDIEWGARGNPSTLSGIGPRLNLQNFQHRTTQDLGDNIRGGVQSARDTARLVERSVWQKVKQVQASDDALAMLPGEIRAGLSQVGIPVNQNTPTAAKMVDFLREYRAGRAPAGADEFVPDMANKSVDQVRRVLGKMVSDAHTPTDKAAADAVYRSYNNWIAKAGDAGHFPPDVSGSMRAARQISSEIKSLFEPRDGGRLTPAAKRIGDIIQKADTPEGVISTLFGHVGAKAEMPAGTTTVLQNLKTALEKYAPTTGRETWNDIRLAYWQRITSDGAGNLAGPQALANNIKTARAKHGSAWNILFTPEEQQMMVAFQKQVANAAYRPSNFRTNSSGTAFAGASMIKDFLQNIWKVIASAPGAIASTPAVSATFGAAARPVTAGWYKAQAQRATNQAIREVQPSLGAIGGAIGSARERNR